MYAHLLRCFFIETGVQFFIYAERVPKKVYKEILRQYRTNRDTRLACILFRHIALKILALRQQSFRFFVQSDEKSNYAIRTPQLCGIALKFT